MSHPRRSAAGPPGATSHVWSLWEATAAFAGETSRTSFARWLAKMLDRPTPAKPWAEVGRDRSGPPAAPIRRVVATTAVDSRQAGGIDGMALVSLAGSHILPFAFWPMGVMPCGPRLRVTVHRCPRGGAGRRPATSDGQGSLRWVGRCRQCRRLCHPLWQGLVVRRYKPTTAAGTITTRMRMTTLLVAGCSPEFSNTRSLSESMFRPPFLGPEFVKLASGRQWKVVGNIESELLAVVAEPHDRSAGGPELGDIGADRSRNAPVGDTNIETELTAVVRTGRIEELADGDSEACGQTEKLVYRSVPAASLYCADRRAPPAVAEMLHARGKFVLSHMPKGAIRPEVRGQSV